jgi:hypothetical protein
MEQAKVSETMQDTTATEESGVLTGAVLEKAHTLVGTRRNLLTDMQKALGELRAFGKEVEAAERQYEADREQAMEEERKTVAALDAELEAAKRQHALRVEEARQVSARAVNQSKSRMGMARARYENAGDLYQKLKRNLTKLVAELPV